MSNVRGRTRIMFQAAVVCGFCALFFKITVLVDRLGLEV